MACWLPSFCFEDESSAQQQQRDDGAARKLTIGVKKQTPKIVVPGSEMAAKTPSGSQESFTEVVTENVSMGFLSPQVATPLSPTPTKDVPKSFLCPITLDLMKDPVMLVETMQTYDRTSIRRWFDWGGATCPVTGKQLVCQEVVNNPAIRMAISEWKQFGWKRTKNSTEKKGKGGNSTSPCKVEKSPPVTRSLKVEEKSRSPRVKSKSCNPMTRPPLSPSHVGGGLCGRRSLPRTLHMQPPIHHNSVTGYLAGDSHTVQQQSMGFVVTPQFVGIGATMANEIMQRRATVFESDHAGWTALHWAAKEDDPEVAQLLIQMGARVEQPSTKEVFIEGMGVCAGANPLHVAAILGSARAAQVLVECGADLEAHANFEMHQTPMHIAARLGHVDVVEVLARNGGDVSARDYLMDTPLHVAALKGHLPVVEVLLQHGADGASVNGRGKKASELVTESCNYFEQFSNLSPLDEFKMMEMLDQRATSGEAWN